jgi:acyl-CoA thioesterase-1
MNGRIIFSLALLLGACSPASDNKNATVETTVAESATSSGHKKKIVFFGDSLTAAYGLDDVSKGYVSLLQLRLDSLALPYQAVNAGVSGETTAGGKERVEWVLRQPADIFVLELGGNDALRGIQPDASYDNLKAIVETVKQKCPGAKIVLAGMQAPPNLGQQYTNAFKENYTRLAKEYNLALIPFFLEGVGGVKELNQGDGIHPNEKGQLVLLENVWKTLQPLL